MGTEPAVMASISTWRGWTRLWRSRPLPRPRAPAPLARDAFIYDLSPDGRKLYMLGGDPVSEEVPNFVADLWVLDLDAQSWTERIGLGTE